MAQKFKYTTAYTEDNVSSKSFDRDTSFFKKAQRAAEGEDASRPNHGDYAGALSDRGKPVDSDLAFSGGNSGFQGGKSEGENGNT